MHRVKPARRGGAVAAAVCAAALGLAATAQADKPADPGKPPPPGAQPAGTLQIEGVAQTSQIYSYSWGISNPVTIGSGAGGISPGRASISSFNLMKNADGLSTTLADAVAHGTPFPSAKVSVSIGTGASPFSIVYDMDDVYVESYQASGSGGEQVESASLAFRTMTYHVGGMSTSTLGEMPGS